MGDPLMFNHFLKRRKSMKCSYDKTFTLTTSLVIARSVAEKQQNDVLTKAHAVQSALETVRSVECGLFA